MDFVYIYIGCSCKILTQGKMKLPNFLTSYSNIKKCKRIVLSLCSNNLYFLLLQESCENRSQIKLGV